MRDGETESIGSLFAKNEPLSPFLCPLPAREALGSPEFYWLRPLLPWRDEAKEAFRKIRQSPAMRRLWLSVAAVNNQTAWCEVPDTDIMGFAREARMWCAELPERSLLWTRLSGGMEDFLLHLCETRVAIGTSCLTTPPGMSFCETTRSCYLFGATQLKLAEIPSTTAATPCV